MKVIFEVDMNTDSGRNDFFILKNAEDFYLALEDIRAEIRRNIKYSDLDENTERILTVIQNLLPEEM